MPRIPTYTATESLATGPTSPFMDPRSAAAPGFAMQEFGESLLTAGSQVSRIAEDHRAVEERKKRDTEARWVSDRITQFSMKATDFERQNRESEDFGELTKEHLTRLATEFQKDAPSARAITRLRSLMNSQIAARYEQNDQIGARNRVAASTRSIDENISNAMAAYRADANNSADYAAGNMEQLRAQMHQSVAERWGGIAPGVAAKLHSHIDDSIIIGAAPSDPAYADVVLEDSQHIDEQRRAALRNHIQAAQRDNDELNQTITLQRLEDSLAVALEKGQPVAFAPDAFTVFGDDAEKVAFKYQQKADAINKAIAIGDKIKGKSADFIGNEIAKARENVKGESDHAALNNARQVASRAIELQDKDPAGYLLQNNSEIALAFSRAKAAPEGEQAPRLHAAYETLLRFQGAAPEGLPAEEAGKYLNLPTGAQRLLSQSQAETYALEINRGKPSEQIQRLRQLEAQFGKLWPQAYSDLVNLPEGKGIPQEMRLALLIHDPATQAQYLGAITNEKDIRSLADETKAKFRAALDTNPTWRLFQQPIIGDNFQRSGELAGYKNGLLSYAYALSVNKGHSPAEAVRKAVDDVLTTHFGFADVRGQVIAVPRWRTDQAAPWRNDADIKDIGRRLTLALREVPTEEIRLTDTYGRNIFATAMIAPEGPERRKHIQDAITNNGFWVSDPDGQSVTLYLKSDAGAGQPVDKNGQPFRVVLDELPAFQRSEVKMYDWRTGRSTTNTFNETPRRSYPLNAQPNRDLFLNLRRPSRITTLQHVPATLE